jgi:hypothetical protein
MGDAIPGNKWVVTTTITASAYAIAFRGSGTLAGVAAHVRYE